MHTTKTGYRPDIDGLRAIAVIAVMLYHFKVSFVTGGFVGVDIFFVISGYLITKIISSKSSMEHFGYADFYLRRVRRLIPALMVTISVSYLMAFFMFSPSDFKPMSGSAVYALAGISNLFFWFESGYFDAAATLKPLLHTWSLGVEIQFYILWPCLLLLVYRTTSKPLIPIIGVLLFGMIVSVLYLKVDASGAFFLAPFRIHEFLFGAVIVFIERYSLSKAISSVVYVLGLGMIAYSIFFFSSDTTLFPGLAALVPTGGAALMILGGRNSVIARPFTSRPVVKVGEISYSLYLVHWPLFVFVNYILVDNIERLDKLGLIAGTFALALALYYFVEKPLRHQCSTGLSGSAFSLVIVVLSIMLMVPAASSWAQNGWGWRVPAEIRNMTNIDERAASLYVFALIKSLNEKESFEASSKKEKLLVIGDSQAGDLLNILNEEGYTSKFNMVSRLVDSACATPLLDKEKQNDFFTKVNPIVIKQPEYIKRCEIGLSRADNQALISAADKIFIAFYWRDFAEPYYLEAIRNIASHTAAEVYVFGRKDLLKDSAFIATSFGRSAGLARYAVKFKSPETEKINKPLEQLKNVKYIDMMQATCPPDGGCLVVDSNHKPVFFNATHLSKEGAKMYGPATRVLLDRAGDEVSAAKNKVVSQ